jgi:predicted phage terminase large subunit-like protein
VQPVAVPPLSFVQAELARKSLRHFVRFAWPIVEPSTPYVHNWHIDVICAHLEAVTRGEIKYLLINIPPRQMKSTIVSVMWPAWEWLQRPGLRYLSASFQQSLSVRDAGRSRLLMQSRWYREHFGDVFRFRGDQDAKGRYENNKGGMRIALSTESGGTGEGGDRLLYDDPHSLKDSQSVAAQRNAIQFWTEVMGTRGNSSETARIVIMQRSGPDDLSGYCLEDQRYRDNHICIPLEWDGKARSTLFMPGGYDPRTVVGELLWPARFDAESVANLKRDVRAYGVNAQLQQTPTYRGSETNAILNKFARYEEGYPPTVGYKFQSWDTASKPGSGNAHNAAGTFEADELGISLTHVLREQYTYPALKRAVVSYAKEYRPDAVLIEDKDSGQALLQELPTMQDWLALNIPLIAITPLASKLMRWAVETESIESGRVHVPNNAAWLIDFEAEVASYPHGVSKDRVDMMSQAINHWRTHLGQFDLSTPTFASGATRTFGKSRTVRAQ